MVYELPSSFSGGIQGAVESLKKGTLPQDKNPVVVPPAPIITQEQKTFLPQKPKPVDPNKTPDVFKAKFVAKYPEGVAQDGRKYKDIPAVEIVAKIVRKYPNGVTSDGIPYTDFLPRPASPSDSLEYRLSQIESLYGGPKSQFFTDGKMRGQTEKEKQFTTDVVNRKNEGEIMKTIKAPYRGLESVGQNLAYGTFGAGADVLDLFGGDKLAGKMRKSVEQEKFKTGMTNQNKGLIGGLQSGELSSVIETLSSGAGYLATGAKIPLYLMAIAQGGNLSQEGEEQGQGGFLDKTLAYGTGTLSSAIDRMSGQKVIGGLTKVGIKKETATTFVQRMNNYLKGLKPSDFEAGTEIIQQKIENIGRSLMGVNYDKGIQQYFEVGLLGKVLGKVGDKGFSESPITTLPPKQPKVVSKNLDVIQSIKTGITGNKIIKQAKNRGFDPELDIAAYEDLKPTITNDGRVNTDVAQENLQNFIEPYQEKLDQAIAEEGAFVPSETFRQNVLKEMESEKTNIVDYDKWVKMANNAIDSAVQSFGDEKGNIPLEVVNNIKKKLQSVSNYQNPDDSAYKAIARGAKQIVEDFTSSADVRALNKDLARWYTTKEYLQILGSGTKTVKGGRLGKGVARLAGVIIGSKLGPVAGMIGGEIGAKLQGKMMQGALKSTKKGIPDILSFGKIKKKQQLFLPPPSGKPLSAKVVDVKPITGFLPGLLQKSESALSRQISSNNTEDKTTQSQLVRVLGGKRKKEVVLPKKESASKKVNNPIIQKLAKKQETPKTPQVDTELASLQKLQESLPGLPKVEVPADYKPTDGLPTGTEFESTILPTKTKSNKIPSPDVKRPQIRGIDLGIRSNMIDSLKQEGVFTDSFFAITDKNLSKKFIDYAEQKAIKKGISTSGKEVSMSRLLDTAKKSADTPLVPKEYVRGTDGEKGIYLRFDLGDGNKVAINSSYADIFFKNFDDVTFKGSNELSPVIVYSKGNDVGVIMPIKDPYGAKEVLGDFTTTTKQSLPLSSKSEVKEAPKTPQVEGETLEQGTFGGVKGVQPKNQAKFNQGDNFEPVRVVMNDKDARIVRYGAIRGRGLKKGFTSADNAEMKGILDELNITREEAINRSDEIKKLAREARSAKEEVILDLTKNK